MALEPGSSLTVWVDVEQNGVASLWQVMLRVRRVLECSERQRNSYLKGGLRELCSRGRLLGVHPKSHIGSEWVGL